MCYKIFLQVFHITIYYPRRLVGRHNSATRCNTWQGRSRASTSLHGWISTAGPLCLLATRGAAPPPLNTTVAAAAAATSIPHHCLRVRPPANPSTSHTINLFSQIYSQTPPSLFQYLNLLSTHSFQYFFPLTKLAQ